MESLKDCIQAMPEEPELALLFCRMASTEKHYDEVYHAALAAITHMDASDSKLEEPKIREQLIIVLNNAVFELLPKHLIPPSISNIDAVLDAVRLILAKYPKAAQVRLKAAKWLIQAAEKESKWLTPAAELIKEGFDHLLSETEVKEAQELLIQAGSGSEMIERVAQSRKLLDSATQKAKEAMARLEHDRSSDSKTEALQLLESALEEAAEAEQIALAAGLNSAVERAKDAKAMLQELIARVR